MYDLEHMDKRLIIYANSFLVANRLQAMMDAELDEVTAKQWLMLIVLDVFDEPPTLSQVSKFCSTSHQNTKQIITKLKVKGYVDIVKDPNDSRAMRIVGTKKIEEINKKYDKQSKVFIEKMFSGLSKKEIEVMCEAQMKIYDSLEKLGKGEM